MRKYIIQHSDGKTERLISVDEGLDKLAHDIWSSIGEQDWEGHVGDVSWYLASLLDMTEKEVEEELSERLRKIRQNENNA